jgi:hypothetical protein
LSIIYDALKKSQKTRAAKSRTPTARVIARKLADKRKHVLFTLLILTSLFFIITALTMTGGSSLRLKLISKKAPPPVKVQPVVVKLAAAPRLMLDGVFLSEREKLAMINHHSYHEGDTINGMQVVSIGFDEVELKGNSRSIKLRSALTQLD